MIFIGRGAKKAMSTKGLNVNKLIEGEFNGERGAKKAMSTKRLNVNKSTKGEFMGREVQKRQ